MSKPKLRSIGGGSGGETPPSSQSVSLNEHELAQVRAVDEALRQATLALGQIRSSYLEQEERAYNQLVAAKKKLAALIESAVVSRGLAGQGPSTWVWSGKTGELVRNE